MESHSELERFPLSGKIESRARLFKASLAERAHQEVNLSVLQLYNQIHGNFLLKK